MSRKQHGVGIRSRNPDFLPRIAVSAGTLRQLVITIVVPAGILLALTLWATSYPPIPLPSSPTGAMVILTIITLGIAFVMRGFRLRLGLEDVAALVLPDPEVSRFVDAVVAKPFEPADLLAAIRGSLDAAGGG